MALPKTLTVEDLAAVLHKDVATVAADVSRAPERLPPRLVIPGQKKPLWLEDDVVEWLRQCSAGAASRVRKPVRRKRSGD